MNIRKLLESGFDVIFDIDWQGAQQLKKSYYPNILTIFIIPPSKDAIYERLKRRAIESGDNAQSINFRMDQYQTEMSHQNEYDFVVENNDFEKCVSKIKEIIKNARSELNS